MRDWIALIAGGGFEEAFRQIDGQDTHGHTASPSELELAVRNSILGLPVHQFEKVRRKGIQPSVTIVELVEGVVYAAEYHLPAYDEWDSLTLEFRFREQNGQFAVTLEGIR